MWAWFFSIEKILDKGMHCPNEDKVWISSILLEGRAQYWWNIEKTRRCHTWETFKRAFDLKFYPESYK